jgi:hypothetical protein
LRRATHGDAFSGEADHHNRAVKADPYASSIAISATALGGQVEREMVAPGFRHPAFRQDMAAIYDAAIQSELMRSKSRGVMPARLPPISYPPLDLTVS